MADDRIVTEATELLDALDVRTIVGYPGARLADLQMTARTRVGDT